MEKKFKERDEAGPGRPTRIATLTKGSRLERGEVARNRSRFTWPELPMTSSSRPQILRSPRLRLVPCAAAVARSADAGGASAVEALLGIRVDPSWPAPDLREILLGYAEALEEDPSLYGWGLWLILDASGKELIGDLGLKGKPDEDGSVEIGYGIVESFRRQGFATEAVRTLIEWAGSFPEVKRITARCYTVNFASIGVLEKLGFTQCGIDDGILEWELHCDSA